MAGDFTLVLLSLAKPGAHVKKGDVVAEFDRQYQLLRLDDYKASLDQLDANIEKMRADLKVAKEAHEQLVRSAKADLDKALLDVKTIEVRSEIESENFKLNVEEARAKYKQMLDDAKLLDTSQKAQVRASEAGRGRRGRRAALATAARERASAAGGAVRARGSRLRPRDG